MQKVVAIAPNPSRAERVAGSKGPVKVYDSLYLGSRLDARNVRKLKALGITAVVDCAPEYKAIDAKQTKQCFAESDCLSSTCMTTSAFSQNSEHMQRKPLTLSISIAIRTKKCSCIVILEHLEQQASSWPT